MQSYRKILLFSVLALSLASCSKRVNCDSQEATINENNLVFKEITSYVKMKKIFLSQIHPKKRNL